MYFSGEHENFSMTVIGVVGKLICADEIGLLTQCVYSWCSLQMNVISWCDQYLLFSKKKKESGSVTSFS